MLPHRFLDRPLAHRGLHDTARGRVENSASAFRAAIAGDYGIELDVQISADGHPVVFHDARLDRLTRETGPISARSAQDLAHIALGNTRDTILTLRDTLDLIDGRVPVLIEIKDQTGSPGENLGIDRAVADVLHGRDNADGKSLAVMSFNPLYMMTFRDFGDTVPRGLTTGPADVYDEALVDRIGADLVRIAHYAEAECRFVSHDRRDLDNPRLAELKADGAHVICWTVRSQAEADAAQRVAHNITFEGFEPA